MQRFTFFEHPIYILHIFQCQTFSVIPNQPQTFQMTLSNIGIQMFLEYSPENIHNSRYCFRHGTHSLTLSKFIPDIVNLLSDPSVAVRDTAFSTLVDLYKHVGDKLRIDLQKRNLVPPSKWSTLTQRFDEAKARGELLPSALKSLDCK